MGDDIFTVASFAKIFLYEKTDIVKAFSFSCSGPRNMGSCSTDIKTYIKNLSSCGHHYSSVCLNSSPNQTSCGKRDVEA